MNKTLLKLKNHFINKNFNEVIKLSEEIIKNGHNIPVIINLLSASYEATGQLNQSEKILQEATKNFPNDISFRVNIGRVKKKLNKFKEAEENLLHGLKINEEDNHLLFEYGILKLKLKYFEDSNKIFKKLCKININFPDALLNLAQSYLDLGYETNEQKYYDEAKINFLKCSKMFPSRVYADFQLSDLIDYSIDDSHQKIMLEKDKKLKLNPRLKSLLYRGLVKSYEDQNNFDEAYKFLKLSNNFRNSLINKNLITDEINKFKKIKEIFLEINSYKLSPKNICNKKIIFIVGLPRSGTTLIHQLIEASTQADGLGESPILNRNLNNLLKLKKLNKNFVKNLIKNINNEYEKSSQKKILIDKLPINFYWLGIIKILLPYSKVVHVNRNLKDVALSIYKNMFGSNDMDWSYDEENIFKFIKNYKEIMFFWKQLYPDFIYDIHYEKLINNKNEESKKLFKFCDLIWNENIFNFYKAGKRIKTASISQVKKPIYTKSINSSDKYIGKMTFLKKIEKI